MKITLIIPAKNESESLPKVLDELKNFDYETIIILKNNDESTIKSISNYKTKIVYQDGFGYGDALIKGIDSVKTEYFCIFNADGSFNPKEIDNMLKKIIEQKLDLIFASRYQKNSGSDDDTIITLIGNYFFSFLGKIFFRLNITDILYTFLIGKTEEVKKLNLKSKDFRFCVELPIKAKKNNMKMISVSSYERKRIGGKKKVNELKDGFLILIHMIQLFFWNKK